ncbi:MAG: tetratricopeptide repeat protein [Thermoanaerobaculaceae bacterium]|jgi:hypothetical protein
MSLRAGLLTAILLCFALAAQAADPFYMRLLRQGTDAFNRRDFPAAVRQLRVACFGLLDEPELLADGLVRLGLAQASAGDTAGFAETFQRLAEVEERFGGYSKASIPSDVRDVFQQLVVKLIPRPTLAERPAIARLMPLPSTAGATAAPTRPAVPSPVRTATVAPPTATPAAAATLVPTATPTRSAVPSPGRSATAVAPTTALAVGATLVPATPASISAVPSPSRTGAVAAPTPTITPVVAATPVPTVEPTRTPVPTPRETPVSAAPGPSAASSGVEPATSSGSLTSPPSVAPSPSPAAASSPKRVPTAAEQRELDAIQELVRKEKIGDALARARRLADAHADLAEAQFVAAELAYRTMRWPETVAYFRRAGDPGDGRPLLLFYEAVAVYETGDVERAAAVLKRALPKIRRTSYVESYVQKILSPGAATTRKP